MALFNEILVARYNRALQKLLGLKGAPPSPQLSPEIDVTLSAPGGVEERYLWGWESFGFAQTTGAVAEQNTAFKLRNPPTSNVIAVVFKIMVTAGVVVAFDVEIENGDVDLAAT